MGEFLQIASRDDAGRFFNLQETEIQSVTYETIDITPPYQIGSVIVALHPPPAPDQFMIILARRIEDMRDLVLTHGPDGCRVGDLKYVCQAIIQDHSGNCLEFRTSGQREDSHFTQADVQQLNAN